MSKKQNLTHLDGCSIGDKIDNLVSYLENHHEIYAEFILSSALQRLCGFDCTATVMIKGTPVSSWYKLAKTKSTNGN